VVEELGDMMMKWSKGRGLIYIINSYGENFKHYYY